jgi:hypothetical protein
MTKPSGASHNGALAFTVAKLAERIEEDTGKRWLDDPFTGLALRYAIEALLFHFAPLAAGDPAIPPRVEESPTASWPLLRKTAAPQRNALSYSLTLRSNSPR